VSSAPQLRGRRGSWPYDARILAYDARILAYDARILAYDARILAL